MRVSVLATLLFSPVIALLSPEPSRAQHPTIEKYELQGEAIHLGLGSGLAILSEDSSGTVFLSVSDAGASDIGPVIGYFELRDNQLSMLSHKVADDPSLDLEGVAPIVESDSVWLVDETGPSLLQLDLSGRIAQKLSPGNGLPESLSFAQPNRGFEGLCSTPSGALVFALQSTLASKDDQKEDSLLTRIFRFDPEGNEIEVFAYLPELELYESAADVRISGLSCVSENEWLVLERGALANGGYANRVYLLDAAHATELQNQVSQLEPESAADYQELFDEQEIIPLSKRLVINLRQYGWNREKSEGIALSQDRKTLYLTNDPSVGESEPTELWKITFPHQIGSRSSFFTKTWEYFLIFLVTVFILRLSTYGLRLISGGKIRNR